MSPTPSPCARTAATAAATREKENGGPQAVNNMGPQSQRRLTLKERTHQMKGNTNKKKKKGGQQALFGEVAFDPEKDCEVCKARLWGRSVHRSHHELCTNNRNKRGQSVATLSLEKEEKRLKVLFSTPLTEAEKCSGQHLTKEATEAYFKPREGVKKIVTTINTTSTTTTVTAQSIATGSQNVKTRVTANDLHSAATERVKDPNFVKSHEKSTAPLAMLALAKTVVERIINKKEINNQNYFNGLTLTVPPARNFVEPECHSLVGQKLLNVDWKMMYGIDISCLRCGRGVMENKRTNFSHNQVLFPIFEIDGPPLWCMVRSLKCPCCHWRVDANDSEILCALPAYARNAYPVETKCALDKRNCHLGRSAAAVMDLLMPTCGNGDLCCRLFCNAINRAHLQRVEDCHSSYKTKKKEGATIKHVEKDGSFTRNYPPLGDALRDAYDAAASCKNTWNQ